MLHDWCNKGCGMCYQPLLLIGRSSPCGSSGFPLSQSEWFFIICPMPYNCKLNVLSASLNKTFPSFLPSKVIAYLVYTYNISVAVSSVKFAHDDKSRVACSSLDGTLSICQLIPPPATVICMLRGHSAGVTGKFLLNRLLHM